MLRFLLWCCWHLTEEEPCVLFPRCGFSRCPGLKRPPVGLPRQLRESWSSQSSQTSGCLSSDRWATHTPTHTHTYTFDAKNSAKSPKMTLGLYTEVKSNHFQMLVLQSRFLQGRSCTWCWLWIGFLSRCQAKQWSWDFGLASLNSDPGSKPQPGPGLLKVLTEVTPLPRRECGPQLSVEPVSRVASRSSFTTSGLLVVLFSQWLFSRAALDTKTIMMIMMTKNYIRGCLLCM